jgi:hypothetical protein
MGQRPFQQIAVSEGVADAAFERLHRLDPGVHSSPVFI